MLQIVCVIFLVNYGFALPYCIHFVNFDSNNKE